MQTWIDIVCPEVSQYPLLCVRLTEDGCLELTAEIANLLKTYFEHRAFHDPEKYFELRKQELLETYFMGSTVDG